MFNGVANLNRILVLVGICLYSKLSMAITGGESVELSNDPVFIHSVGIVMIPPIISESQGAQANLGCSGALIHPKIVITAAHCVAQRSDISPENLMRFGVFAGFDFNLTKHENGNVNYRENPEIIRVQQIRFPLEYLDPEICHGEQTCFDIAVLLLEKELTPIKKPIPVLWGLNVIEFPVNQVSVAGFGRDYSPDVVPKYGKLKKMSSTLLRLDDERTKFVVLGYSPEDSHFATTSNGDSGGPLMMLISGTWTLLGVLSRTEIWDFQHSKFSYFESISSHAEWLRRNLDELLKEVSTPEKHQT